MYGNMTYFEGLIECKLSETPMRPGLTIARAIIEWGHNATFRKLRGPLTTAFMKFKRSLELSHRLEVLSSGMEQDELRMRVRAFFGKPTSDARDPSQSAGAVFQFGRIRTRKKRH